MVYSRNDKKDIWNGYLNEIRHDAIARQKQVTPTDADIELLGRMIYYVMSFAKAARTYGLLAVEEEALHLDLENEAEAILHEAAELIVDGSSPECVAEILSNYYWISQPEGYAATAAYIGIRGALLVQEGVNPYSVQLIAGSMLPVKIREKCIEVCRNYEAQEQKSKDEIAKVADFDETTKKISNIKVVSDTPKEVDLTNPTLLVLDNKLKLSDSAIALLNATANDRIAINYWPVNNEETFPVIGRAEVFTDRDGGNRLTQTNTVSFRGRQRDTLLIYGDQFTLEEFKDGMFKLVPIKSVNDETQVLNEAEEINGLASSSNST